MCYYSPFLKVVQLNKCRIGMLMTKQLFLMENLQLAKCDWLWDWGGGVFLSVESGSQNKKARSSILTLAPLVELRARSALCAWYRQSCSLTSHKTEEEREGRRYDNEEIKRKEEGEKYWTNVIDWTTKPGCVCVCVHVLLILWVHTSLYTMALWGLLLNAGPHDVNTF